MDDEGGTASVLLTNDPAGWFSFKLHMLLDAVDAELPNALDPAQIEGIHDMRVATRRLRSALRDIDLVLGHHPAKAASQGLKALADALGAVRDEDVAIHELEKMSAECDSERIRLGIAELIEIRRVRRESAFTDLQKDLSVDFQQELRHRFETSMEVLLDRFEHTSYTEVRDFGREIIVSLMSELSGLGVGLCDPFDRKTLHRARISAKRLRYAIDLFSECWSPQIVQYSKELARMQGYLGDAHDRDVWMTDLFTLIKDLKYSDTAETPQLEAAAWLISQYVKERTKNYRDALELWADWKKRDFSGSLREAIETI